MIRYNNDSLFFLVLRIKKFDGNGYKVFTIDSYFKSKV